ncbi:hypothetical protein [Mycoplasmopsis bovigenitalium]|uniref:hypothetical protein n=1 Tax=Mycoplasmopsis bovigenitalium TaxID=2112 RepID=UPI000BBB4874|nr:hypothetical protein [Mycoplasmopsis bovigenitalium]
MRIRKIKTVFFWVLFAISIVVLIYAIYAVATITKSYKIANELYFRVFEPTEKKEFIKLASGINTKLTKDAIKIHPDSVYLFEAFSRKQSAYQSLIVNSLGPASEQALQEIFKEGLKDLKGSDILTLDKTDPNNWVIYAKPTVINDKGLQVSSPYDIVPIKDLWKIVHSLRVEHFGPITVNYQALNAIKTNWIIVTLFMSIITATSGGYASYNTYKLVKQKP